MRADLQRFYGLNLDDAGSKYSWAHAAACVAYLPQESSLAQAINPESMWGLETMLLAELVDVQRWQAWTKTKDGQRGRNRPQLVPRPGIAQKQRTADAVAVDIDQAANLLNAPRI